MKNKLLEVFNGNNTLKIHSASYNTEKTLTCRVVVPGYRESCSFYNQIITKKLKEIDPNSDIQIYVVTCEWF